MTAIPKRPLRQTEKQREVMRVIIKSAMSGNFLTLEDLRAQLSYGAKVSKQAVLQTVRTLEAHGFVAKNYKGNRSMELKPTEAGLMLFHTPGAPTS